MNDGRSQTEQMNAWLEEGLRFYSQGDPSRALEAWHRILDVDAAHALAQQYVAYVRQVYRLDAVSTPSAATPAPTATTPSSTAPAPSTPTAAPEPPPAPTEEPAAPATAALASAGTPVPTGAIDADAKKLLGFDSGSSWSDLVDSSFDVTVPVETTPAKPVPRAPPVAATPKMAANPWAVPSRKPVEAARSSSAAEPAADPWATPGASLSSPGHVMPAPADDLGALRELPPEPPPAASEPLAFAEAPPAEPPPLEPMEMEIPTAGTEEPLPQSHAGLFEGDGFDPWRGDTVPPMQAPAEWAAAASGSFDIPPTPPPLTPEQIAAAMIPPERAAPPAPAAEIDVEVEVPVDAQMVVGVASAEAEATAPVPAWKQTAVEQVGTAELGPRLRNVGGNRVDVLPGATPPADRTAAWPVGRVDERVLKQSVRFGDEPMSAPVAPGQSDAVPGKVVDPWDEVGGPGVSIDLDEEAVVGSPLADVLGHDKTPGGFSTASLHSVTSGVPEDECTALMRGARELFELGDFSGSLDLVEKVLKLEPEHEGACAYLQRNEATLIKMYESKLDMRKTPKQLMPPDEVIWMNMHHKAGFLLSQVDGMLAYEDLLEVSGMSRFDTMRILHELVQQGIIG